MAEATPESTAEPVSEPVVTSRWLGLREPPSMLVGMILGVVCIAVWFGVWWFFQHGPQEGRLYNQPGPGEVFGSLPGVLDAGLVGHIAATLKRVFLGFGLSIVVGVSLGFLAGSWRPMQSFAAPVVLLGRSLPLAALIPLTIAWFGIGDKQKVMFIFIATVPFIFSDATIAVINVHRRYVETSQTLGASAWQTVRKVLIPLALPQIYTNMRFLFGLAFGYIMLAETVDAGAGIGHFINILYRRGDYASIYLLLFIIGLLAYGIDRFLAFFEKGLFPYKGAA